MHVPAVTVPSFPHIEIPAPWWRGIAAGAARHKHALNGCPLLRWKASCEPRSKQVLRGRLTWAQAGGGAYQHLCAHRLLRLRLPRPHPLPLLLPLPHCLCFEAIVELRQSGRQAGSQIWRQGIAKHDEAHVRGASSYLCVVASVLNIYLLMLSNLAILYGFNGRCLCLPCVVRLRLHPPPPRPIPSRPVSLCQNMRSIAVGGIERPKSRAGQPPTRC